MAKNGPGLGRSVSKKDTLKGWSSIEVKAPVVIGSFMKCLLLTSDCFYARLGNIRFFKWNLTYRKRTLDEFPVPPLPTTLANGIVGATPLYVERVSPP